MNRTRQSSLARVALALGGLGLAMALAPRGGHAGRLPKCTQFCGSGAVGDGVGCPTSPDAGCPVQCVKNGNPPAANCCSNLGPTELACAATDPATLSTTARKNILLVISDDHGYCHYGFMSGKCQSSGHPCWSRRDCDVSEACVTNRVCEGSTTPCTSDLDCGGGTLCVSDSTQTIHLNELTCRNRQPARAAGASTGCADRNDDDGTTDKDHFAFDRLAFPCADTVDRAPGQPGPTRPPLTPTLDRLAAQGALFPRAHVGATSCKPSRRVIHHGKHQRHLQYLFPPARAVAECAQASGYGAKGCYRDSYGANDPTCPSGATRACEPVHSIAWWLRKAPGAPTGLPACRCTAGGGCPAGQTCNPTSNLCESGGTPVACDKTNPGAACSVSGQVCIDDGTYVAAAFAKLEVLNEQSGSFDSPASDTSRAIGKFSCEGSGSCGPLSSTGGVVPKQALYLRRGVGEVTAFIDSVERQDVVARGTTAGGHPTSRLLRPFYIWYGPHMPHKGFAPDAPFRAAFGQKAERETQHFARIALLDTQVGAILDHLQRTCVCSQQGVRQSLYQQTVVVFLADHGFLLPGAKNSPPIENAQRTPLIISEPRHRVSGAGGLKPQVFDYEQAHAIDVLPTILGYAGIPYGEAATYPWSKDLSAVIGARTAASMSSVQVRHVQYGEEGHSKVSQPNWNNNDGGAEHYMIPRRGLLGICRATAANGPVDGPITPCANDDGTHCDAGETCQMPAETWGQRCVNWPRRTCSADSDCVVAASCNEGTGRCAAPSLTNGVYRDFSATDVTCGGDADCVPRGVCRPLMLKLQTKNLEFIEHVWDLDIDPDQTTNRLVDATYRTTLGGNFKLQLENCLKDFWQLHAGGNYSKTWQGDTPRTCPWPRP